MAFMKVMVTSNDTGIVVHGMTTMQRRLQYGATPIQVALCHPFKTLVILALTSCIVIKVENITQICKLATFGLTIARISDEISFLLFCLVQKWKDTPCVISSRKQTLKI